MKKIHKLRSNMSFMIIGGIIILLTVFGSVVSIMGYVSFTDVFKKEYSTSSYHMVDTAALLINGNHVDAYLEGGEKEEYEETAKALDAYCYKMNVSLIYLIKVDTSDYGRFVSIFNAVNNEVDNSSYTPWELGYEREATNDEYRQKYEALYKQETEYETVYRTETTDGSHPHITTLVPVKNSAGEVVSILCMQRPIGELIKARRPYLVNIAISAVSLAVVSGISTVLFIRKQFVIPIQKVSAEATRFAKENTKGESLGGISRYDNLSNLANSIDKMEEDMVSYINNLTAVTAEKERIGAELALANTIQANSIPNKFPAFPDRIEFDIYASMKPAKEVGGDFYNYFLIDDDHLAITIGDVSGKGVPAALFMMATNIVLSNRTLMGGTPAEILAFVNKNICDHNEVNMFVTLWLGILEISTGRMIASNAGHDDAAVYRKDGYFEIIPSKHGIAIGAMQGVKYTDFEIQLGPGDKIFLYTDGAIEATDKDDNMFTFGRLTDSLNKHKEGSPQEVLAGVDADINDFVGDAPQFDDLTMLCLEVK